MALNMALQASGSASAVQSSSHALERLQRPLPDVLRLPLVRHFESWGNVAEIGGRDLAVALVKVLEADCPPGSLDAFANSFSAAYLRHVRSVR
jgi:hypothetical protein